MILLSLLIAVLSIWHGVSHGQLINDGVTPSRMINNVIRAFVLVMVGMLVYVAPGEELRWWIPHVGAIYIILFNSSVNLSRKPRKGIFYLSSKKFPEKYFKKIPAGELLYFCLVLMVLFATSVLIFDHRFNVPQI